MSFYYLVQYKIHPLLQVIQVLKQPHTNYHHHWCNVLIVEFCVNFMLDTTRCIFMFLFWPRVRKIFLLVSTGLQLSLLPSLPIVGSWKLILYEVSKAFWMHFCKPTTSGKIQCCLKTKLPPFADDGAHCNERLIHGFVTFFRLIISLPSLLKFPLIHYGVLLIWCASRNVMFVFSRGVSRSSSVGFKTTDDVCF